MSEVSTDVVNTGGSVATVRDQVNNIASGNVAIFSTFQGDSQADKVALFNAVNDAEPISENLGTVIKLANVVAQVVEVEQDDQTMAEAIRVILVDVEGKAYSGLSNGLFKSIENLFAIVGQPHTWETDSIDITVVEAKSRKGRKFFTVKLA